MADNWSSSVASLTDAGEWAKWTITLGSGDASDLNGTPDNYFALRHAMTAASRTGYFALIINDTVAVGSGLAPKVAQSSAGWVSGERFRGGSDLTGAEAGFLSVGFPVESVNETGRGIVGAAPWVAGSNTVRLLWLGSASGTLGAPEGFEIDFLAIQAGSGLSVINRWGNFGLDSSATGADIKPVTTAGHVGFDDHTDPDPLAAGDDKNTWILKGGDATTGTAADSELTVTHFCPAGGSIEASIRVTGSGSPLSGVAGAARLGGGTPDTQITTLDGAGEASFTLDGGDDYVFFYGGTDDWTPASMKIDEADRVGCHGWHVGYIAMAS